MLASLHQLYTACGFSYTQPMPEAESADYDACTFVVNGLKVRYRQGKVTPNKTGLFVTIWQRIGNVPIQPFNVADDNDLYLIAVTDGVEQGHFVFTKNVLLHNGVLSGNVKEGKRGIRVYPPWAATHSKQALKTQQWQQPYYMPTAATTANKQLAQRLYGI